MIPVQQMLTVEMIHAIKGEVPVRRFSLFVKKGNVLQSQQNMKVIPAPDIIILNYLILRIQNVWILAVMVFVNAQKIKIGVLMIVKKKSFAVIVL